MDFEKTFPLRYWINLGRRTDRRGETEWRLSEAGITAERFAAVDSRFVKRMSLERKKEQMASLAPVPPVDPAPPKAAGPLTDLPQHLPPVARGYSSVGRYALALTQRLAIRRADQLGAEAVLLLEDDVVFHPNFRALIAGIEIPDDWGMLFLGCQHTLEPVPCAPGVVRVSHAIDTHAVAISRKYYKKVMAALDAFGKPTPEHPLASDRFLAALQSEIPSYACFPNLAWQSNQSSDLLDATYTNYHRGGTQKAGLDLVERTFASLSGIKPNLPGTIRPKLGLLFLTRGDVNHPEIWSQFVDECPDRVRVFSHPKSPGDVEEGFLKGTVIPEYYETAWGNISLVRATLALLRNALQDEELTHFTLASESCVPICPLSEMLRRLRLDPRSRFGWKELSQCSDLQKNRASALPQIPKACWRFQSQWWLLDRLAAEWLARADYTEVFAGMPIPDEAYFATVLSLLGYPMEDRVHGEDITWADWSKKKGSPNSFLKMDPGTVQRMAQSSAWFARKFPSGSDIGKWSLHRPAPLGEWERIAPVTAV